MAAALCAVFFVSAALAQSAAARGTISGTVTDPQGNAVPGAQVTIRSADFSSARTLTTSDTGIFTAAMLHSRRLHGRGEGPGLQPEEAGARDLGRRQQRATRDSAWAWPAMSQNVTVTGARPHGRGQHAAARGQQGNAGGQQHAGRPDRHLSAESRPRLQPVRTVGRRRSACAQLYRTDRRRPAAQRLQRGVDGADFTDPLQGGERGAQRWLTLLSRRRWFASFRLCTRARPRRSAAPTLDS